MPFSTNFVSGGLTTSGVAVAAGTEQRQLVLDIRDAIIGDANSRWEEVTAASPTPPALQPFASTINAGNASGPAEGFTEHATLYLADDSGLSLGTPGARMLRIYVGGEGLQIAMIDSAVADPATQANWHLGNAGSDSIDPTQHYQYAFPNLNALDGGGSTGADAWQIDCRLFFALDDDFLWVGMHWPGITSPTVSSDLRSSGVFFYHPEPPTNATVGREDMAWIFHIAATPFSNLGFEQTAEVPASPAYPAYTSMDFGPPMDIGATDFQGRELLLPNLLSSDLGDPNAWLMDGMFTRLRAMRKSVVAESNEFQEIDVGGTPFLVLGAYNNNIPDFIWALRVVA